MPLRFPTRRLLPALALSALLAACGDAPTLPTSFVQQAGGKTWVAVAEPRGLAEVKTWLPWLSSADAARARGVLADAAVARRAGQLERAGEMEAYARSWAAGAVTAAPSPARLERLAAALREWELRAAERSAEGSYPELDSVRTAVAAERAAA